MHEARRQKDVRFAAWQQQTEAQRQRRTMEVAIQRKVVVSRQAEQHLGRDERLANALVLAEKRRLRMAREKAEQLQQRELENEQRSEDAWQARVRVMEALREREAHLEAEVKRKMQQAETCLEKRAREVESRRRANLVWVNSTSSLHASSSTSSLA